MTKFKKYAIYTGILVILVLMLSLILGNHYDVEINTEIQVPKRYVFNAINELKTQERWNTVLINDTSVTFTYPGSTSGVGGSSEYSGNEVGNGIISILTSQQDDSISIKDLKAGREERLFTYYIGTKDSALTTLRVKAGSNSGFGSNLFNFIHKFTLKKSINQSLDQLKLLLAERYEKSIYNGFQVTKMNPGPKFYIIHRAEVKFENLSQYYTQNISALYQKALNSNIVISGMPCGLYYNWDEAKGTTDMAAALPTLSQLIIPETSSINIPAKPTLQIEFFGNKSGEAHKAMDDYMNDRRLLPNLPVIEEYVTDPSKEADPEKKVTHIIYYYSEL